MGVFRRKESDFPHFKTLFETGPINIQPVTCEPVYVFHLYFNTDIMADFVECTNAVGEHIFATKLKVSKGTNMGRYIPTSIAK